MAKDEEGPSSHSQPLSREGARFTASGYRVSDDAIGLVGASPMVRLGRLSAAQGATVWAKCEFMNPGGSVKDRPALNMVLQAEREGKLNEHSVIVEATSGNTGISLAMIAAIRGHRCILVMPEDMSMERRYILQAYGAEIELTSAQKGMAGAVERAKQIAEKLPQAFTPGQFSNPSNPESHYLSTAREIWEQMDGKISAFVAGVGTGGTLTGVGEFLREQMQPAPKLIAVEPQSSPVLSGGRPGLHGIQGLGAGFVPPVLNREIIDEVIQVSDVAAERTVRQLAQREGLLVGPSAGANVAAALIVAEKLGKGNVVTILCDSGERYLF
jgi:cysteine synthase